MNNFHNNQDYRLFKSLIDYPIYNFGMVESFRKKAVRKAEVSKNISRIVNGLDLYKVIQL
jgi:hypothetical protein